jgi:Fe-S cluster assembly protein SufD
MNTVTHVLPTTDEEIWRYSRIGELDLGAFRAGEAATTVTGAEGLGSADPGAAMSAAPDVFAAINGESPATVGLRVPRGKVHPRTVEVLHEVRDGGAMVRPRLVIDAESDSEITVVERFVSPDGVRSLVLPVAEIRAAAAARVTYVAINELGRDAWMVGHQCAVVGRDASVRTFTVALGGDYARVRAEVRLVEQGAGAQQTALYFADGSQMHDFRTLQVHEAPRTRSDLLFKGAVKDSARSVYTGLIRITEQGTKSEAFQTNRNLTLSHGAWAESVPNLEIETNDVKCSHASTVGPIDEAQRFYLESRGVPPDVAERLVVLGFFDEVIDRLPAIGAVSAVRSKVGAKLGVAR